LIALIIDVHRLFRADVHRRSTFQFLGKTSYILEFRSTAWASLDDRPARGSLPERSNEPSLHDVKATRRIARTWRDDRRNRCVRTSGDPELDAR